MKLKKFQKVTLSENAVLYSINETRFKDGVHNEKTRKFAGLDAVVMRIDGDLITLAIDHDGKPETEPITITVKSQYIETLSVLWGLWLAIKRIFKR